MRDIPINLFEFARTFDTPLGQVRSAAVASPSAKRIRLHIRWVEPEPRGILLVYSPKNLREVYSYPLRDPAAPVDFWTPPLEGDVAIFEYLIPPDNPLPEGEAPFLVPSLSHTFLDPAELSLGPTPQHHCTHPSVPASWDLARRGVVGLDYIASPDQLFCSGALLNSFAGDFTPYILTANHCLSSAADANTLRVWWLYDSSGQSLSSRPRSDRAELLETGNAATSSDFTFLRLLGSLPRDDVAWLGWTTSMPSFGEAVVGVHHPGGSYKRISYGDVGTGCPGGECVPNICSNFLPVDWDNTYGGQGIEKGSSGSPLFRDNSSNPQVVGQLYCGVPCSTIGNSHYGRFSVTYNRISSYLQGGSDDNLEQNDSRTQARSLSAGSYSSLIVKYLDEDWYRISVPGGAEITARTTFEHDYGDLDLELFKGSGTTPVDTSESTSDSEEVTHVNSSSTSDYFLRVFLFEGVRNRYTLVITIDNLAPSVTTGSASSVGQSGAVLNGTVNPNGSSTTAHFQWGTTTSYGNTTSSQSVGSGTSSLPYSQSLSGLPCATLHHFRAVAGNSGGTSFGSDRTFTTSACSASPPNVTTGSATGVGQTSATLNGTVNPNGSSTTAFFQWGTTTSYENSTQSQGMGSGNSSLPYGQAISGLSCNTLYHFRAAANNSGGTAFGSDQTFTTSGCAAPPPTVTTGSATSVGQTSATLNGTVNPNGSSTTSFFQWGTTTSYGNNTPSQSMGSGNSSLSYTQLITNLSCNTLYHFRAVASNANGSSNGSDAIFVTSTCPPSAGQDYFTVTPCRIADTRPGPPLQSDLQYSLQVAGNCGIPFSAVAVAANITVVSPTGHGHLTVWPWDLPRPLASNINFSPGQTRANNAIVMLATDGFGDVRVGPFVTSNGTVHFLLDVFGYFE